MANISSLLDTIRTAIYGRDMRLALHDAIKTINDDTETRLSKDGGNINGEINMGDNKVISTATPTDNKDYTNKRYVDEKDAEVLERVDEKDTEVLSYENNNYPECTTIKQAINKLFDKVQKEHGLH